MKNSFEEDKFKMEKKKNLPKMCCKCKTNGIFWKRIEEKLWLENLESFITFFKIKCNFSN